MNSDGDGGGDGGDGGAFIADSGGSGGGSWGPGSPSTDPQRRLCINGAPIIEQSHEYVMPRKPEPNAPNP